MENNIRRRLIAAQTGCLYCGKKIIIEGLFCSMKCKKKIKGLKKQRKKMCLCVNCGRPLTKKEKKVCENCLKDLDLLSREIKTQLNTMRENLKNGR